MKHPVCIIPVRGGSKGIPRKNLQEIVPGISLLEWTLAQALEVFPAEDVVVSTEDNELATIAAASEARLSHRPAHLAYDESTTAEVVTHLLQQIDPENTIYDAIMILQVTSPLRQASDIRRALDLGRCNDFDAVVSAYETVDCHPAKLYFMYHGIAEPVKPEMQYARRQDLPKVYRRNGGIFLVRRDHFDKTGFLWGGRTAIVDMPRARSIDIDVPEDLEQARASLKETYGGVQ